MENESFHLNRTTDICEDPITSLNPFQIVWISLAIVVIIINVLLFVVMVFQWTILRHHVVYYYTVSVVLASMMYCFMGLLEFQILKPDATAGSLRFDKSNQHHVRKLTTYAVRKALLPCMFLVINLTDMSLIYGVSDNAYFVGRYSDPKIVSRSQFDLAVFRNSELAKKRVSLEVRAIRWRKCKAALSILFSWLFPLSLIIPVGLGWNCIKYCSCLPAFYPRATCTPNLNGTTICSRVWNTVSQSFTIVICTIWYISKLMTIILLSKTVQQFFRIHKPRESIRQSISSQNKPQGSWTKKEDTSQRGQSSEKRTADFENRSGAQERTTHYTLYPSNMNVKYCTFQKQVEIRNRLYSTLSNIHSDRPPLDPMIKLLISLVVLSGISFLPVTTLWLLDVTILTSEENLLNSILLSLSFSYVLILPIILVKYMSGLRQAIRTTLTKCPCLRTVTIVERKRKEPVHEARTRAETTISSVNVVTNVATASVISNMGSVLPGNDPSISDGSDTPGKGLHAATAENGKNVFSLTVSDYDDDKIHSTLQEVNKKKEEI